MNANANEGRRETKGHTWGNIPGAPMHWATPKLTPAQRQEIGYRRMEGESRQALALEYGVSSRTIAQCPKMERPI